MTALERIGHSAQHHCRPPRFSAKPDSHQPCLTISHTHTLTPSFAPGYPIILAPPLSSTFTSPTPPPFRFLVSIFFSFFLYCCRLILAATCTHTPLSVPGPRARKKSRVHKPKWPSFSTLNPPKTQPRRCLQRASSTSSGTPPLFFLSYHHRVEIQINQPQASRSSS